MTATSIAYKQKWTRALLNKSSHPLFLAILFAFLTISLGGCSKEDAPIAPEKEVVDISNGKAWSVSVSAVKGVQDSQTKSVKQNSSEDSLSVEDGWEGESKENSDDDTKLLYLTNFENTLNFEWEDGDKVQVYKGSELVGELTIDASRSNVYLKGYLHGNFSKNEELTFYTISKDRNYHNQKGTIEDISKNYDYAMATSIIEHIDNENNALIIQPAHFESRQSINRIMINTGYATSIKKLIISGSGLEGESVTVIPENTSSSGSTKLFVALSNPKDKKITYNFTLELENGKVVTTYKRANLKDGKYYKATINSSVVYETIREPLTIESLEDGGTITISNPKGKKFFYAINNPTPDDFVHISLVMTDANPITISVNEGDRVQLYGNSFTSCYGDDYVDKSTVINCDVPHYVYGNTNSLRYSSGWWTEENSKDAQSYLFANMFFSNTEQLSHPFKKIILPATKVGQYAYFGMFINCQKMTTPPDLPATVLADACYRFMFNHCYSLKYAPELPATTLAFYCYASMFANCTTLESSPILPAKELVIGCYNYMFSDCKNLKQITCYAEKVFYIHQPIGVTKWTEGVSPTGIFIKNENTSWPSGNDGIPTGWKNDEPFTIEAIEDGDIVITNPQGLTIKYGKTISLNNAVSENSTTITIPVEAGDRVRFWGNNSAYGNVSELYLCTTIKGTAEHYAYGDLRSLISDSDYPNVTTLSKEAFCALFMFNDQLKSHPALELRFNVESVEEYACYQMFYSCTKLERAPKLTATNISECAYEGMFASCESLTEAPELPAENIDEGCYAAMFAGCTNLVDAPALPATTLASYCYANMFDACTSLQNAPELKAATLVDGCYAYMFRDCKNLNKITCLATNISATEALECWVENVATSGTFTKKSGVTWPTGNSGRPSGWSVTNK